MEYVWYWHHYWELMASYGWEYCMSLTLERPPKSEFGRAVEVVYIGCYTLLTDAMGQNRQWRSLMEDLQE